MASPNQQVDMKILRAKQCSKDAVKAGAKAAVIACVASTIPTVLGARAIPWARANLNHTAQALIISTISGSAYFIVADKTILKSARRNSFHKQMESQSHAEYSQKIIPGAARSEKKNFFHEQMKNNAQYCPF